MRTRGRSLQIRLCADRYRPFGLRLRLDRAARVLGGGYPQCDERHSRRQHCALLKQSLPIAVMEEGSVVITTCEVEDQVTRRTNWNTWIVMCSLIVVVAAVLLIEHQIRGLIVHPGGLR